MNKIIKSAFLIVLALHLSCTKDADIKLPAYIPVLVVHGYISPLDSAVIVYVNLSRSAFDRDFNGMNNVIDASVIISDGTISGALQFVPSANPGELSFYYLDSTSFKIIAGHSYNLKVTTPDGKVATASTTIPFVVQIKTLDYQLTVSQNQFNNDSLYIMKFTFQDPAGQEDYYKFGTYVLDIDTVSGIINPNTNEQNGIYFSNDGSLITETMDAYRPYRGGQATEVYKIDFRLYHVTREYYLYHQSIDHSGGGPFAEPSVPFTNITGGAGVFAGYNYDLRMIRL